MQTPVTKRRLMARVFALASMVLAVALFEAPLTAAPAAPNVPAAADVRLKVVIFPAVGLPYPATGTAIYSATQPKTDVLDSLASKIASAYPLYSACEYDPTVVPAPACDPTTASILITTQFYADPQPADPKNPNLLVTMRSFDMVNRRALATVSLTPIDVSTLTPAGTVDPDAALKAIAPGPDKISQLLGTPSITNGQLTLFQGYEPYIQLVPTLVNPNDPTYETLVANLLDRRGLPSVPSQFNAGTVASGSTPLDSICSRGQRYFVYSVSSEKFSHPVSFSTRIQTHASAQLFDCTNMTVLPLGLDQHENVLTTTGPFASLIGILSAAIVSHSNSWAGTLQVSSLLGAFIDGAPDSVTIRDHVADRALQGLVDNLCTTLANAPTPVPAPSLSPIAVSVTIPVSTPKAVKTAAPTKAATPPPAALKAKTALDAAQTKLVAAAKTNDKKQVATAVANVQKASHNYNLVLQAVGSSALAKLINNATTGTTSTAGGSGGGTAPQAAPQTTTTLVSIDVANFVAQAPPKLICHDPRLDHANETLNASPSPRWSTQLH